MTELATITDRNTLTFVRYFPGPIDRIWAYLTDPKFLVKWLSDGTVASTVGGDVHLEMGATGHVTVYDPPHVLEYTWNEEDASVGPVVNSLVRWELAEEHERVRLTLTHTRLPEVEIWGHGAGWHAFLDRLAASAEGRDPEPFENVYPQLKASYVPVVQSAGIHAHVS